VLEPRVSLVHRAISDTRERLELRDRLDPLAQQVPRVLRELRDPRAPPDLRHRLAPREPPDRLEPLDLQPRLARLVLQDLQDLQDPLVLRVQRRQPGLRDRQE